MLWITQNSFIRRGEYLIVDTAVTSAAGLSWLQKADIIISPFQPHYADIKTILDWFHVINSTLQKKVMFVASAKNVGYRKRWLFASFSLK